MFEYVQELLNERLEKDMQQYDVKQEYKDDIEMQISKLEEFQKLRYELKASKVWLGFSISILVIILGMIVTIGPNILFGITGLFSLVKMLQNNKIITEVNQILNNDYSEYVNLTIDEIYKVEKELMKIDEKIESDIKMLETSIRENIERLSMLEQDSLQQDFLTSDGLCLREAKNHEELENLRKRKQTCTDYFGFYLDEKIDYANVHFNNRIGKKREFTESNKKLLKKI